MSYMVLQQCVFRMPHEHHQVVSITIFVALNPLIDEALEIVQPGWVYLARLVTVTLPTVQRRGKYLSGVVFDQPRVSSSPSASGSGGEGTPSKVAAAGDLECAILEASSP